MKKHTLLKLITVVTFATILGVASCQKDEDSISTDPRDKIVGEWFCKETSGVNGTTTFKITISKNSGTDVEGITIANLNNLNNATKIAGTFSGSGMTITRQLVSGYDIFGSGTLGADNKLKLNYTVDDKQIKEVCSAECTKI
jgi:hypothetical protein